MIVRRPAFLNSQRVLNAAGCAVYNSDKVGKTLVGSVGPLIVVTIIPPIGG